MTRMSRLLLIVVPLSISALALTACVKQSSTNTSTQTNTVQNPGLILSITPNKGSAAGGTSVTIHGQNFTGTPTVSFGTASATSVSVKSDTEITVITPAGTAGKVDVTLQNADGPTSTLQAGFTYQ